MKVFVTIGITTLKVSIQCHEHVYSIAHYIFFRHNDSFSFFISLNLLPPRLRGSNFEHQHCILYLPPKLGSCSTTWAYQSKTPRVYSIKVDTKYEFIVISCSKVKKVLNDVKCLGTCKVEWNPKACQDNWNSLNNEFKDNHDYFVGTKNNTSYEEMSLIDHKRLHLPNQFVHKFYDNLLIFLKVTSPSIFNCVHKICRLQMTQCTYLNHHSFKRHPYWKFGW
jgi:hypothetical protein